MAVNGVDAVEQGNLEACFGGPGVAFLRELQPGLRRIISGVGAAAAEHGAERVFLDVRPVLERVGIDLSHLADFLIEGHLAEQGFHAGIDAGLRLCVRARGNESAGEAERE